MSTSFPDFFRTPNRSRDRYIARLFALFSDEAVRYWCEAKLGPYEYLGRPVLKAVELERPVSLDFALKERATGKVYAALQRALVEFDDYRYLTLRDGGQLIHLPDKNFQHFLKFAEHPGSYRVELKGRYIDASGAVLVWASATPEGRASAKSLYGFADILSLEELLAQLRTKMPQQWKNRLGELKSWNTQLLDFLNG
jgi:hypothetical protein